MQQFQRSHIIQGHFYSAFSYGPNCSKRRILAGPQSTDIISFMSQKPLRSVFLVCLSFCTIPERHPVMKQIARKKAHAADMQEPRAVIKRSKSPSISLSHSFLSTLHKGVNSRQIIAKIHTAGLSRLRHSRLRLHLYQQLVLEWILWPGWQPAQPGHVCILKIQNKMSYPNCLLGIGLGPCHLLGIVWETISCPLLKVYQVSC